MALRGGLVAGALVLACCASARATFPGVNWRIAYTSDRSGQTDVFSSRLDGSGELDATSDPESNATPAWSPDARQIAFTTTARCGDFTCDSVEVADADGANRRTIAASSPEDPFLGDPAWSPDGTRLSWVVESEEPEIMIGDLAGGEPVGVSTAPALINSVREPTWSPDGRWIAFLGETSGCATLFCPVEAVYRVPVQAPPPVVPEQMSVAIPASTVGQDGVTWSPDGGTIAYSAGGTLYTIPTTSGIHAGNPISVSTEPSPASDPAWSPDGSKLAYDTYLPGTITTSSIWIVPVSGGAAQQFPAGSTSVDYGPDWQPAQPPVAMITGGPSGPTQQRTATFTFSAESFAATPGSATFACALDPRDGALRPCSGAGEDVNAGLAPGTYTFSVVPTDTDGLTGAAVTRSWQVLPHPAPHTRILTGPNSTTTSSSATFTFEADETGVTFECALANGPWRRCASAGRDAITGLAVGAYSFSVRATNDDGVSDPNPPTWRWSVVPFRLPKKTIPLARWDHPGFGPSVEILQWLKVLSASAGITVDAVCRGPGCPRQAARRWHIRRSGSQSLRWVAVGRALRPGASVDVRLSKPRFIGVGKVYCIYFRGGRAREASVAYQLDAQRPSCARFGLR